MWRVGGFGFGSMDFYLCFVERMPSARPRHSRRLSFATFPSSTFYTSKYFSLRLTLFLLDSLPHCDTKIKCLDLRYFHERDASQRGNWEEAFARLLNLMGGQDFASLHVQSRTDPNVDSSTSKFLINWLWRGLLPWRGWGIEGFSWCFWYWIWVSY